MTMVKRLLIVFLSLLGSSVSGFFGRFLGSEGTAIITTPNFILPLFILLVILIMVYQILLSKRKNSVLLLFFIYFLIEILISLIFIWVGIPVIAYCADEDEAVPEQPSNVPSGGSTSKGTWWKRWITCFTPQTEEGGHSVSPPEQIPNRVEEVDLPNESPSDTIDDLRLKCAIILESFSKTQTRDHFTWHDIAQRLVLEGKDAGVGATREDFQRLLGELKNPTSDVYLRVLKALEKHPR